MSDRFRGSDPAGRPADFGGTLPPRRLRQLEVAPDPLAPSPGCSDEQCEQCAVHGSDCVACLILGAVSGGVAVLVVLGLLWVFV
jgi:hypothetical protein